MTNKTSFSVCSIFLLSVVLVSCATPVSEQQVAYRTYYESLDLSTPESAVKVFVNAFQQSDFPTVFWVLSPEAQNNFMMSLNLLEYERLLKLDPSLNPVKATRPILEGTPLLKISEMEHYGEVNYYFDVLMMAAKEHSAFIIDLNGEIEIKDTIPSSDNQYINVVTSVKGIDGNVIFRTVQSPSKRWRVLQVILPDGDESQIPWSTPKLSEQ